jgi:hypothetical protein
MIVLVCISVPHFGQFILFPQKFREVGKWSQSKNQFRLLSGVALSFHDRSNCIAFSILSVGGFIMGYRDAIRLVDST